MKTRQAWILALGASLLMAVVARAVDTSLVLYLPFDEGSGAKANDKSGNGNDGALAGGAKWVDGKMGKALQFDGTGMVTVKHNANLEPDTEVTVMAWVNIDKAGAGELMIVSKGQWAANDMPYELSVVPGKSMFWQFFDNAGHDECQAKTPAGGEWHHIAGTYDGKEFALFVDGDKAATFPYKAKLPKNGADVVVGRRSKANETWYKGVIDEVAIFNKALSPAEVAERMLAVTPAAVEPTGKSATSWGELKR